MLRVDPAIVAEEPELGGSPDAADGGFVGTSPVTRTTTDDVRVAFGE